VTVIEVDATEYVQVGATACVTVTATPFNPDGSLPGRCRAWGLVPMAKTAVPGPLPEPVVTEMNDCDCESTVAVQLQPDGIETATLKGPALPGSGPDGPVSVGAVHGAPPE
jgi:hypothetical protein